MKHFRIEFDGEVSRAEFRSDDITLTLAAPVLGAASPFSFPLPDGNAHEEDGTWVHDCGEWVVGFLQGERGMDLEAATGALYDRMFEFIGDRSLYRVWHFVPQINAQGADLENYRLFCRARANAFARILGANDYRRISAASAVGTQETEPVFLFAAGRAEPEHAENPEQVPAYRYPPLYGPRSPSFARATRVSAEGREIVFISGTSSIKGSDTVHPNDCPKQVMVKLHNLSLIGERSKLGSDLGRSLGASRRFVVYLRRREDFPRVDAILREQLFAPGDEKVFLLADICRADLTVEIEATVLLPG